MTAPTTRCTVLLKPGREKPILHGHPLVFSGAIAEWHGRPAVGEAVDLFSSKGDWLARGLAHPAAGAAVRIYSRTRETPLDAVFLTGLVEQAVLLRQRIIAPSADTDGYRLVHADADGLSGLVVDRYGEGLAVKVAAGALVPHLPALLAALRTLTGCARIHVDADAEDATREGIDLAAVRALGDWSGGAASFRQAGLMFEADPAAGQKTGFYLDQRINRTRIAAYARDARVLSAYCYTGALEVHLDRAAARSVLAIDSSAPALVQARRHAAMNGVGIPVEWMQADVPEALRRLRDAARQFDLIVLDPPKFVLHEGQLEKGLRAYKDINLLAMKLLVPGGILATFSCSGLVTREHLATVLAWSAKDAGRTVQIVEQLGQPPDHPVRIGIPESEYLRGCIAVIR